MTQKRFVLEIKDISFGYKKNKIILDKINFSLQTGEIVCLLGESGCGKSSLLSLILGEFLPFSGEIKVLDTIVSSVQTWVSIEKRNIGIVLQDLCLFPSLTVEQNITFGLIKWSKSEKQKQLLKMLEIIYMKDLRHRYPHELSGGQKQRVALARALAPQPLLLLLDEPFASLDESLRIKLCVEVKEILKALKITALMVTHNKKEASLFADRIGQLKNNNIIWDKKS